MAFAIIVPNPHLIREGIPVERVNVAGTGAEEMSGFSDPDIAYEIAERIAIKMDSGISEGDATRQAHAERCRHGLLRDCPSCLDREEFLFDTEAF